MAKRSEVERARIHAAERLSVDAVRWSDGTISIEGQDLGPDTPGGGEYEYFIEVAPEGVDSLLAALQTPFVEEAVHQLVLQGEAIVLHGETRWLQGHGVPFRLETW
jgi:hypothetical protein